MWRHLHLVSRKMSALNKSSVPLSRLESRSSFGSVRRLLFSVAPSLRRLGDVYAVKVVGSEGAVALGALPLAGVVAHLEAFVAEHVEALGEHRLLVSHVAAWAAQLGLETGK